MDKERIEYLHRTGQMPDWYYYQINGKSAFENLQEQHQKMIDRYRQRENINRELQIYKERRKAEIDAEIEKQIEEEITPKIESILDELFSDFK